MEVNVISEERVKPSSSQVHLLKPCKLSLLDQLSPTSFFSFVVFYSTTDDSKRSQISDKLKSSLSNTLTSFYPLSGRVKDNFIIHDFDEGIPYIEAQVKGNLSEFLQNPQLELLNRFLPCQPFCHQPDPAMAQVAVQVNFFDCGGMALGLCLSHKIGDAATAASFLQSWAGNASEYSGTQAVQVQPDLSHPSLLFPPQEKLSSHYTSLMESFVFTENKCTVRRFVFDPDSIATLKARAKSETVQNPTRVETLCAFIWESAIAASRSISGSLKPWISSQAVNIRRRTRPRMSVHSVGSLVWNPTAFYNPNDSNGAEIGMQDLVPLIRDSIAKVNEEYLMSVAGEKGGFAILDEVNEAAEIFKEKPYTLAFTSWQWLGVNETDFGWGKPVWVGIFGEASDSSPCDSNLIILKDVGRNNATEAWISLEEKLMAVLEKDPHFLQFVSPNPPICVDSETNT